MIINGKLESKIYAAYSGYDQLAAELILVSDLQRAERSYLPRAGTLRLMLSFCCDLFDPTPSRSRPLPEYAPQGLDFDNRIVNFCLHHFFELLF